MNKVQRLFREEVGIISRSAGHLIMKIYGEDIVYSPNKYRVTEGIKDAKPYFNE